MVNAKPNIYKYKAYLYKPALTSEQQLALYDDYILNGNVEAKSKIAISYVCYISKLVNNSQLPNKEDAISELLMIAYNAIDKYDRTKASIYTYLYRVLHTKLIDRIRALNTRNKYISDIDVDTMLLFAESDGNGTCDDDCIRACSEHITSTQDDVIHNNDKQVVNCAINNLSKDEKMLIVMRYYNSSSIANIMKTIGVNRKRYGEIESSAMEKIKNNESVLELWSHIGGKNERK